jgi:hypothetical protein
VGAHGSGDDYRQLELAEYQQPGEHPFAKSSGNIAA